MVKNANPPGNAGDSRNIGSISALGRSPGERNGNPLMILAWKSLWIEEFDRLQPMGSKRVGHDRVTEHTHTHTHLVIRLQDKNTYLYLVFLNLQT